MTSLLYILVTDWRTSYSASWQLYEWKDLKLAKAEDWVWAYQQFILSIFFPPIVVQPTLPASPLCKPLNYWMFFWLQFLLLVLPPDIQSLLSQVITITKTLEMFENGLDRWKKKESFIEGIFYLQATFSFFCFFPFVTIHACRPVASLWPHTSPWTFSQQ